MATRKHPARLADGRKHPVTITPAERVRCQYPGCHREVRYPAGHRDEALTAHYRNRHGLPAGD